MMTTTHPQPAHVLQGGDHSRLAGALLAALPHLLILPTFFGVFGAVSGISRYLYFLLVVLIVTLLYAWRNNWPLWSGSWAGYALLPIAAGLTLLIISPNIGAPRLLGLALFLILGCALIAIRLPLHALLASLPLLALLPRIYHFENLQGGSLIYGAVFALLAITSSFIVWRGAGRAAIIATALFHLLTGAVYTAGRFFLPYNLGPFSVGMEAPPRTIPTFADLAGHFFPTTLAVIAASLALLLAPAIWRVIWRRLRPQAAN